MRKIQHLVAAFAIGLTPLANAQATHKVVDIPTRPGVTQRLLVVAPPESKAAVVLIPGGTEACRFFLMDQ